MTSGGTREAGSVLPSLKPDPQYDNSTQHGLTEGTKINGAVQCEVEKLSEEDSGTATGSAQE
jgi:hypothetical protein